MNHRNKRTQSLAVFISVCSALFIFMLRDTQLMKHFEYMTRDMRTVYFRDAQHLDPRLMILDVDDASMQELGPWAWPRKTHGQLVSFLSEKGAHCVSFDVLFTEKDLTNEASDRAFSELLQGTPTCLAMMFHGDEIQRRKEKGPDEDVQKWAVKTQLQGDALINQHNVAVPDALFANAVRWVAPIDVEADSDGVYRKRIAIRQLEGRHYVGIDVATAAMVHGIDSKDIYYQQDVGILFKGVPSRVGGTFTIPLMPDAKMRINYYGGSFTYPYMPYYRILYAYRYERSIIPYSILADILGPLLKSKVEVILEDPLDTATYNELRQKIASQILILLDGNDELEGALDPTVYASLANVLTEVATEIFEEEVLRVEVSEIEIRLQAHFKKLLSEKILPTSTDVHKDYADFIADIDKRIYIVGSSSVELRDQRVSPYDANAPGVEMVATGINNILAEDYLFVAKAVVVLCIMLFLAWIISSGTLLLSISRASVAFLLTLLGYTFISIVLYRYYNYLIPVCAPMLGGFSSFVITVSIQQIIEGKERGILKETFGRFVSPALVRQIMKNPSLVSLGGETRNMSVSFSGMVSFSKQTSERTPEEVVALLQESHTRMTEVILHSSGTLDKFEGDTIMAFWGAPIASDDHPLKGCCAILDNIAALEDMNNRWVQKGWSPLTMEAGLNTGDMVVGNIGSIKKMNYSIIGDTVNTAARVRGANKIYGTTFVITSFTWERIKDKLVTRLLDPILFIGKSEPIGVYEVICRNEDLTDSLRAKVASWDSAKEAYVQRRWDDAREGFEYIQSTFGVDPPSQLFLQRIEAFIQSPPADDWDGRYVMQTK